jgi:hypothetical protein
VWPYRLAQHIDAGDPVRFADGHAGCMLRLWTALVADVTDAAAAVGLAGVVNQQESMSDVVYDSERAVLSEAFTPSLAVNSVATVTRHVVLLAVGGWRVLHSPGCRPTAPGGTSTGAGAPRSVR